MNLRSRTAMLLLSAAFVVGCNSNSDEVQGPTGTLKGKVTMGGKTLPAGAGVVLQHAKTGRLYMALTDDSGSYVIDKPTTKLPTGRYDVSISQPVEVEDRSPKAVEAALEGPSDGKPPTPPAPPVRIPQKYLNSHESGLGFELEAGDNERTFDLK